MAAVDITVTLAAFGVVVRGTEFDLDVLVGLALIVLELAPVVDVGKVCTT